MFCSRCGKERVEGAIFCAFCGVPFKPVASVSAEVQADHPAHRRDVAKRMQTKHIVFLVVYGLIISFALIEFVRHSLGQNDADSEPTASSPASPNSSSLGVDANGRRPSWSVSDLGCSVTYITSDVNGSIVGFEYIISGKAENMTGLQQEGIELQATIYSPDQKEIIESTNTAQIVSSVVQSNQSFRVDATIPVMEMSAFPEEDLDRELPVQIMLSAAGHQPYSEYAPFYPTIADVRCPALKSEAFRSHAR
jgi:hypothetical protein